MFRVHDNVPQVYIESSRDFQLISRLYDLIFSSVKYDIDTMVNVLDATLVRDDLLELMCSKVGFFPRIKLDANILKYIIASFPYIVKNKGSQRGIKYAVNAIMLSEHRGSTDEVPPVLVDVYNRVGTNLVDNPFGTYYPPYTIVIRTGVEVYNRKALDEVLRYVLPIGYNCVMETYESQQAAANSNMGISNDYNTYTFNDLQLGLMPNNKTLGILSDGVVSSNGSVDSQTKYNRGYGVGTIVSSRELGSLSKEQEEEQE